MIAAFAPLEGSLTDDGAKLQRFMLEACKLSGRDLTSFFEAWRVTLSQATKDAVAALNLAAPGFNVVGAGDACWLLPRHQGGKAASGTVGLRPRRLLWQAACLQRLTRQLALIKQLIPAPTRTRHPMPLQTNSCGGGGSSDTCSNCCAQLYTQGNYTFRERLCAARWHGHGRRRAESAAWPVVPHQYWVAVRGARAYGSKMSCRLACPLRSKPLALGGNPHTPLTLQSQTRAPPARSCLRVGACSAPATPRAPAATPPALCARPAGAG